MPELNAIFGALKTVGVFNKVAGYGLRLTRFLPRYWGRKVESHELSDDEFMFLDRVFHVISSRVYVPIDEEDQRLCKALCNLGVLYPIDDGYRLTRCCRDIMTSTCLS